MSWSRAWSTGRVEGFADVDGPQFFRTVRDNVAEGLFCDPSYGGNRDMIGWRWIGYPGVAEAHGGYGELIEDHDAPHTVAPVPYALKPLLRRVGVEMSAVNLRVDRRLPEADVVIVGLGFAGGIIAAELTKAGVDVVALERGPDRSPEASEYVRKHDELRFRVRQDMQQDAAVETWTFRHDHHEPALPFRYLGAFTPATGVGGSSAHFGGVTTRYVPWEFEVATRTAERYGSAAMPEYTTARDWGIGYDELEPYYDRFEEAIGVSGMAGNLNGSIRPGGNPFEGPRAREFPLPPLKLGRGPALFRDATAALGLHPYQTPSAILSERYRSPDGIERDGCTYCGDCMWHLCSVGAKGDANVAILPVARRSGRLEIRPNSYVGATAAEPGHPSPPGPAVSRPGNWLGEQLDVTG